MTTRADSMPDRWRALHSRRRSRRLTRAQVDRALSILSTWRGGNVPDEGLDLIVGFLRATGGLDEMVRDGELSEGDRDLLNAIYEARNGT